MLNRFKGNILKIIYLHQYFNTPDMSGGTRSYEMAKRMVSAGHEVHMVTSLREEQKQHTDWFTTDEAGIKVHWYPVPYSNNMSYFQRIKAFFSFAFAAKKKAASLQGDVVFATSTPLTIALPAGFTSRKLKVPMVFEVRDLWPEMPIAMGVLKNPIAIYLAKKLEVWAYKNSSAIVALSPGMKQGVTKTGFAEDKVVVIPNGSDNNEFSNDQELAQSFLSNRPWLEGAPLLIYAGTFGRVNGVDYIVHVAKKLKEINSNVKILLVGEGAEKDNAISLAKKLDVFESIVFFENALPKKEMPALFNAATMTSNLVIDLPEARANSANKFFDSLAAGKPILLNHAGWMDEVISHYDCGISAWSKNLKEVAITLDQKMNDEKWLTKAGHSAKKIAMKYFDRDKLASDLLLILASIVESKQFNNKIKDTFIE